MESYEELLRRAKVQFADVPACLMEHVIRDYISRPDYYDQVYNGESTIDPAKPRDTQEDINKLNEYSKNESDIFTNSVSVIGE